MDDATGTLIICAVPFFFFILLVLNTKKEEDIKMRVNKAMTPAPQITDKNGNRYIFAGRVPDIKEIEGQKFINIKEVQQLEIGGQKYIPMGPPKNGNGNGNGKPGNGGGAGSGRVINIL